MIIFFLVDKDKEAVVDIKQFCYNEVGDVLCVGQGDVGQLGLGKRQCISKNRVRKSRGKHGKS